MTNISDGAAAARENARTPGGQFGAQDRTDPEVSLAEPGRTPLETATDELTAASEAVSKAAYDRIRDRAYAGHLTRTRFVPASEQSGYELARYTANTRDVYRDAVDDIDEAVPYLTDPEAVGMTRLGKDTYTLADDAVEYVDEAEARYQEAADRYRQANKAVGAAAGEELRACIPEGVRVAFISDGPERGDFTCTWEGEVDLDTERTIERATSMINFANAQEAGLSHDWETLTWVFD